MTMRHRIDRFALLLLAGAASILPATAQETTGSTSFISLVENPSMETNYILLGMAVLQVVIILTLAGIMKTLGGNGHVWVEYLKSKKAGMLLVALFAGSGLEAQAATPAVALMTSQNLFWWLFLTNLLFFIIIVAQLTVLKGMVRTLSGPVDEAAAKAIAEEPGFADTVLSKLTKRAAPEEEKDILMHHEYDGIRELDNVLPPWWLWLFYGTIIWGVVYLVNMHVINVWPHQDQEYEQEMAQAAIDVEAYLAKAAASVDENTVVQLTDAAVLSSGQATFQEFCKACHGGAGEGNVVGPNLTDAYWIHGGSVNDVFRTIKYGVAEKGMQSWKGDLNPQQMQAVASYILSLQGSNPPNGREPQGDLYVPKGAEAPVDSTAVGSAADSTAVAAVQ
jgi:cytochrome c oxidase cbb3-type subunit 3